MHELGNLEARAQGKRTRQVGTIIRSDPGTCIARCEAAFGETGYLEGGQTDSVLRPIADGVGHLAAL